MVSEDESILDNDNSNLRSTSTHSVAIQTSNEQQAATIEHLHQQGLGIMDHAAIK